MDFTALHRAIGAPAGPLTTELLDATVSNGVRETDDLDWKSELPPIKGIPTTDYPKDVAAMANGGGGVIVYGVEETEKVAVRRVDAGDLTEGHERALRAAAVTAISPPVFGLKIHRLGAESVRAVVVEVPASIDGPHLIYRNELFGAPVRNDADTVWMKERQIEAMYRARFEESRHSADALRALYTEAAAGRDTEERAWIIAVAHPRVPALKVRLDREGARSVLQLAPAVALSYAGREGFHPLENVDTLNPRPGLRRWVAVNQATGDLSRWRESWLSIHHDGSVSMAAAAGGHRKSSDGDFEGWEVESSAIEGSIADAMALLRLTAEATGNDEYEIRVGIEWAGGEPLMVLTRDNSGYVFNGVSTPLHVYSPVEMSVNAAASETDYRQAVYDLAKDCVNQGGVSNLRLIHAPSV